MLVWGTLYLFLLNELPFPTGYGLSENKTTILLMQANL